MAALANLGQCLMQNGQCEKALPLLERCLSISREHLPGDHVDMASGEIVYIVCLTILTITVEEMTCLSADSFVCLSSVLRKLSRCCRSLGDVQRATQLCEESLAIACHCLPDNHPNIALCQLKWLLFV